MTVVSSHKKGYKDENICKKGDRQSPGRTKDASDIPELLRLNWFPAMASATFWLIAPAESCSSSGFPVRPFPLRASETRFETFNWDFIINPVQSAIRRLPNNMFGTSLPETVGLADVLSSKRHSISNIVWSHSQKLSNCSNKHRERRYSPKSPRVRGSWIKSKGSSKHEVGSEVQN